MLEEYVQSSFKDQKGIVSHKSTHNIGQSVISRKSRHPPLEQIRSWIFIWVFDLNVNFNFSDKNCLSNSNLNDNNLVFINSKFFLRSTFIFARLVFRTLPGITAGSLLRNSEQTCQQKVHKETISAKPGRVLNSHLTVLNLLFWLLLSTYWNFF